MPVTKKQDKDHFSRFHQDQHLPCPASLPITGCFAGSAKAAFSLQRLPMSIKRRNDFVIRFSDSERESARTFGYLFARAVFLAGVPSSPKFISSADCRQPGLCDVRVNERAYLARNETTDMAVAFHPPVFASAYEKVAEGGYFLYNCDSPLPGECEREDIIVLPIPATTLSRKLADAPASAEGLILLGALSFFLDLEAAPLLCLCGAKDAGAAITRGRDWAKANYPVRTCQLSIEKSRSVRNGIFISGATATALGAIYAEASFLAWHDNRIFADEYTSLAHKYCGDSSCVTSLHAESGGDALGNVLGATWRGKRAFTITSSLAQMSQALGFACFAELPAVIVNVQTAPGMSRRTMQGDILTAACAARGDTRYPLLFPCNPHECFTMTAQAFNLADSLQTPVLVMSDYDLHNSISVTEPFHWNDKAGTDRGWLVNTKDLENMDTRWARYGAGERDGVCPRTLPGSHRNRGAWVASKVAHDNYGDFTEAPDNYEDNLRRLLKKWESSKPLLPVPHSAFRDPENRLGILFYGSSTHAAYEAVGRFSARDIRFNTLRIRSFPFHYELEDFIRDHRRVFLVEQNRDGQMRQLLVNELGSPAEKIELLQSYDGLPISVDFIEKQLGRVL